MSALRLSKKYLLLIFIFYYDAAWSILGKWKALSFVVGDEILFTFGKL